MDRPTSTDSASPTRWRIDGDFDGRPLVNETDGMVVRAWKGDA